MHQNRFVYETGSGPRPVLLLIGSLGQIAYTNAMFFMFLSFSATLSSKVVLAVSFELIGQRLVDT